MTDEAKAARASYMREYRRKNKARLKEYSRKWREENRDKCKSYIEKAWQKKAEENMMR